MVECLVTFTHVLGAGATGVTWPSESEYEVQSGPSASKERTRASTQRHRGDGEMQGRH